jgi:predicted DNA-binding transcriptional regulator YafY
MQDKEAEHNERLLEAFDTFNALNIKDRISDYIHFEQRRPQGTENFNGLLHAIQNGFEITFAYQKYWRDGRHIRHVQPYALKEYKNRWYLFALNTKDNLYKTFGLDRLSELCITTKKFVRTAFDIENYFRYAFGIISNGNQTPEDIILSFKPVQGKYIKSLPLHPTQEIITDNATELRISLKIHITHDFLMELLSFGENVQVIQPQNLIDELKTRLQNAAKLYE